MLIHTVKSRSDLRKFIQFPYQHYKYDPLWIPPLRSEQWAQFDPRKNPMLDHCEYTLFLAIQDDKVIGRISAFTDDLAIEHWKEKIGLFGSYECVDNPEASRLLLEAARNWLRDRGMQAMRGPWSFASQEWGMVLEGYTPPPVILAPYNPPYYNDQLSVFGFEKVKDLIVYEGNIRKGYKFPERFLKLTDKIKERHKVHIRHIDMDNLEQEVLTMVRMANETISENWGFYPVTEAEGRALARDLKSIVKPEALLLAEDEQGRPIGFAMTLPDVNILLQGMNGRLMPFGWLKLLRGLPKINEYRMWALGVIPEYHGKAIDTLLYRATYEAIYREDLRVEINYVLEDNDRMINALLKLGVEPIRRYRVYQSPI